MIEIIGFIEAAIMGASIFAAMLSFFLLMDKYNEYRYKLDEIDDDKAAKIYFVTFKISSIMSVVSWLSIFVTGIIDIATK